MVKKHTIEHWLNANTATARCDIFDSPLAEIDSSARKGELGDVVDVDIVDEYVYVDFGRGAIICALDEIK